MRRLRLELSETEGESRRVIYWTDIQFAPDSPRAYEVGVLRMWLGRFAKKIVQWVEGKGRWPS